MDFYPSDRLNGRQAEELALGAGVPYGILERENTLWEKGNPDMAYGGSDHARDPKPHSQHKLGRVVSTSISSHLLRAVSKMNSVPPTANPLSGKQRLQR